MPNTTTRLSLQEPLGPDAVSELRLSITNIATTLDSAVQYSATTLASLPDPTIVPDGTLARTTDTKQYFIGNGTTWSRLGGRQYHSFTMDDQTTPYPAATVLGSFFVDPDQGETITLVETIVHCVTVGATPSTFAVQTDHASHGTLANVTGLTALSPTTAATIVTPSSPLVLASLDRVSVAMTNASTGNSLGCTIVIVTQHSP